jgi:hypothetical protein
MIAEYQEIKVFENGREHPVCGQLSFLPIPCRGWASRKDVW